MSGWGLILVRAFARVKVCVHMSPDLTHTTIPSTFRM